MTSDGYEGPEIFEDGFIVRIEGENILFPENFSGYFENLTAEEIKKGMILKPYIFRKNVISEEEEIRLTTKRLGTNVYYVDETFADEWNEETDLNSYLNEIIESTEKSYQGKLLLISQEPEKWLIYYPDEFVKEGEEEKVPSAFDLGLTEEVLNERPLVLDFQDQLYYSSFKDMTIFGEPATALILMNMDNGLIDILNRCFLIVGIAAAIITLFIIWLYLVQRYVKHHTLTSEQKAACHPKRLRKVAFSVSFIGALIILVIALSYQALSSLYREALNNQLSLDIIINRFDSSTQQESSFQKDEEEWYAYFSTGEASHFFALMQSVNKQN